MRAVGHSLAALAALVAVPFGLGVLALRPSWRIGLAERLGRTPVRAPDAVRVSIQNYQHDLIIPFFARSISMPTFATTIPRESLGVSREGFTAC